jgi:hypothetical protein
MTEWNSDIDETRLEGCRRRASRLLLAEKQVLLGGSQRVVLVLGIPRTCST